MVCYCMWGELQFVVPKGIYWANRLGAVFDFFHRKFFSVPCLFAATTNLTFLKICQPLALSVAFHWKSAQSSKTSQRRHYGSQWAIERTIRRKMRHLVLWLLPPFLRNGVHSESSDYGKAVPWRSTWALWEGERMSSSNLGHNSQLNMNIVAKKRVLQVMHPASFWRKVYSS